MQDRDSKIKDKLRERYDKEAVTYEFAKLGLSVTGVDLSPKCIEVAKKRAAEISLNNVQFFLGELENLSMFSDNSFDGAVSFSTLRYVTNVEKCLYEIYRVLKPGAALVADFPNKWCPWFKIIKPFILRKRHINDHAYSAKEVINFFTRAGFKHIDVRMILSSAPYISLCTLPYEKFMESFSNRAGFLRKFAGIIMCKGIK